MEDSEETGTKSSTRTRPRRSSGDESLPQIHSSARSRMRDITFEDSVPKEPILLSDKSQVRSSSSFKESRWRSARKEIPEASLPPDLPTDPPPPMPAESTSRSRWRSRIAEQTARSTPDKSSAAPEQPPPVPSEPPPELPPDDSSSKSRRSHANLPASEHSTTVLSRSTSVPTSNDGPDESPSHSSRRRPGHIDHASSLTEDSLRSLLSQPISVPSHPLPPPVSFDLNMPMSSRRRSLDKEQTPKETPDSIVGLPAARVVSSSSSRSSRTRPSGRALQTQKEPDKTQETSTPKTVTDNDPELKLQSEQDPDAADDMISQFQSLSLTNITEKKGLPPQSSQSDSTLMTSSNISSSEPSSGHSDGTEKLTEKSSHTPVLAQPKLLSSAKIISEQPSRRSSRTLSSSDVPLEEQSHPSPKTLTQPKDRSKTRSPSPRSSRTMSASDIPLDGEEISPQRRPLLKPSQSMEMSYSAARQQRIGGRVAVVTDLDQAAKDMDEQRLKAWFGDSTPSKKEESTPKKKPVAHSEMETDIDEDPLDKKFVTNIQVAGVAGESSTDSDKPSSKKMMPGRQQSKGDVYRPVSLDDAVKYPRTIPGKLDFSQMEVFEGKMLTQWLTSWFDDSHYLHIVLTKHDLRVLIYQFCTHLLAAGVMKSLERQPQETIFSPHCMYYWTHLEAPPPSQADLPGKLMPMWPPQADDTGLDTRPSLKYTEADHQVAMVQLRQDYKEDLDVVRKEHQVELEKCKQEYLCQIQECNNKIGALQQEVEKYRVLAGIEELTQAALSDADAAQREAGLGERRSVHLTNGFATPDDNVGDTGERMIVVTGTPQTTSSLNQQQAATPECLGKDHPVQYISETPPNLQPLHPPSELVPSPEGVGLDEDTPPRPPLPSGMTVAPGGPPGPPPPPVPGGAPPPPPPPPPPGGGPPPPPPPPGMGPPPPPPPPGSAVIKGPLKPLISPKSPMKPLFWQRLQVHDIKTKHKETKNSHLFWEELEEAKVDLDEFDDMFSKVPLEPKKKKDAKPKAKAKKEVAKVLDAKRSQAVGIFLSSLRMDMADIEMAILNLDTSVIDEERLKTVYELRAEDDEWKKIKKQVEKHPDTPLDKPEQFLYDLTQIPDYSDRIFCFIFQTSFQENMSVIESKLNNLKMTCEVLISGKAIKHIFGLILTLGNYMNGGSRTRGQADGFGLEILPKLRDVKGKDNRTSLLHYLVVQYVKRFEGDRAGTERVSLPIPDPSDINQAALVNFDELQKEIKKIKKDFDSAETRFEKVLRSEASKNCQEPFKDIMTEFFTKGKQDFKDQQENLAECHKRFQEIVLMFYMKPKGGDTSVSPDYFFSFWLSFCKEFKDLWKKEQQRIVKQRIKDNENKVKMLKETKTAKAIPKMARKAGGLKDRLSQKGLLG